MAITYRRLEAADARAYRSLRLESMKKHPESFGSGYEAQRKLPQLMFEQALERPYDDRFLCGAFDDQELIGICGCVPLKNDDGQVTGQAELIQVYVRALYSGRKIGLHLVTVVVAEAFKLPYIQQVVLGVKDNNWSAIRVYEQAGFITTGRGEEETYLRMAKARNPIVRDEIS
ncbi:MAG: GNAT family N-acetyltransferase [Candidatus Promineifilaceae bacterium]|nr:GNAT family N-acetyltransferase [Candidatus Promineifilaceae bacterium]